MSLTVVADHRIGTWNVQFGHDVKNHVDLILEHFDSHSLEVLLLQELRDYGKALQAEARLRGYELVWFDKERGSNQQGILVRHPKLLGRSSYFRAGGGWKTVTGADYPGMFPVWCYYDGIIYVSVHAPVSVNWKGRRPVGPLMRVKAYLGFTRRLRRFAKNHPGRSIVMGGDWNATETDAGWGSPIRLARAIAGKLVPPPRGTGHGPIDYFIHRAARRAKLTMEHLKVFPKTGKQMPDHFLVTTRVREYAEKQEFRSA